MRNFLTLALLLFCINVSAQDKYFCPTYVYEGSIQTGKAKKIEINLNFLVLLDSTLVGSYYYKPLNGSLKLVGQLNPDNSFQLVERNSKDKITGFFNGTLINNKENAVGLWTSGDKKRKYSFTINQIHGKSYWDFIRKYRSLYEYKDLDTAIKEFDRVISLDIGDQGVPRLPNDFVKLKYVISTNLMGNQIDTFPVVLSTLSQLEEISLSTNKLVYVGSEIGKLSNLRILIMNNNQLDSLPKEIGQLQNLLYLEIGNNHLTALPEEIKKLTNLQELHIERNNLSEREKQRIKRLLPNCIIHF